MYEKALQRVWGYIRGKNVNVLIWFQHFKLVIVLAAGANVTVKASTGQN